mgnify:CR=1 FL=1
MSNALHRLRFLEHTRTLAASTLTALLVACGGGGGGGSSTPEAPPSGSSVVSGRLMAPDGETPIANALVYLEDSTAVDPVGVDVRPQAPRQLACGTVPESTWAATCTGADGRFSLTAELPGNPRLVAIKGVFRLERGFSASSSGTTALGNVALEAASGARLAVVTGTYDRIQDVLAKLGYGQVNTLGMLQLGTETFALFNGDGSLPTYASFDALFADANSDGRPDLHNYDVVFLNCGLSELSAQDPTRIAALRAYVEAGGRLYVSDLAYDYVEQVFPQYIDFEGGGGTAAHMPEPLGAAEVGRSGITVNASLDPALSAWLASVTCADGACLNSDGTAHIEGFLSGWAVMHGAHPDQSANVRVWAQGPVSFSGQTSPVQRPLTVSFPHGQGRVTYTSYHTEPGFGTGLQPQERILQYLVFEL